MSERILIVDDEPQMRLAMRRVLTRAGYAVEEACDGQEALDKLSTKPFPVVVTDVRMPKLDGLAFLTQARTVAPATAVLMITAFGTVASAVEAVRRGARDYILKPFPPEVLERAVREALEARSADQTIVSSASDRVSAANGGDGEYAANAARPESTGRGSSAVKAGVEGRSFSEEKLFLTCDPVMRTLLERARLAAASEATILIEAESGAGKELLARFIHRASPRRSGPFAALNCAAFPHDLLESELFGHARGAFTGAVRERRGHFEAAGGGTILLDEVGEMSPALQAKLLRVLQEREVQRLGEETPRHVDVRVVASTNRDLGAAVRSGLFREDLYFRLSVIPLRIPPLRERPHDVPLLIEHFCDVFSKKRGTFRVAKAALAALRSAPWPGNVRELENVVHRAVVLAAGEELTYEDFFPEGAPAASALSAGRDAVAGNEAQALAGWPTRGAVAGSGSHSPAGGSADGSVPAWSGTTIDEAERRLIQEALERTGGNRTRSAALVGISVRTLRNKLREYRLRDHGKNLPTVS